MAATRLIGRTIGIASSYPYLIYNTIVYPYWLFKNYMFNGDMPDQFQAIRPILGTLLFEHENSFCEVLNGLLWYLPAILFMHITIDTVQKDQISEIQFFP